mgnify:CR=1 FL=1
MEWASMHNALCSRRRFLAGTSLAGAAGVAAGLGMGGEFSELMNTVIPAAAAATMGAPGGTPQSDSIDYLDPADNLYAFGKVWGTYGDEPVCTSWHGIMAAVIDNKQMRPLFGYTGFGYGQCKITEKGHLRIRANEGNFFTDLATGEILETWKNPYTDETVEVFQFMNDRVRGELNFDMPVFQHGTDKDIPTLMNEATARQRPDGSIPFILPFEEYGSKVMFAWDYAHEYTNPVTPEGWPKASTGPVVNPSEHFVFYIPKAELEDRILPTARFHAGFTRISPFWPWMKMGGSGFEHGKLLGRSFSFKEYTSGFGNMPPKLLAYVEKKYPEYLEAPDDWDDGAPKETWAAYAERVPPENPDYERPAR